MKITIGKLIEWTKKIPEENLPCNIVSNYLKENGLPIELAKLISKGYFDELFSWNDEKAYQIADGEIREPDSCNIFEFGEYIKNKLEDLIDILKQANNQILITDYPFEYFKLFNSTISAINEEIYNTNKNDQQKLEKVL